MDSILHDRITHRSSTALQRSFSLGHVLNNSYYEHYHRETSNHPFYYAVDGRGIRFRFCLFFIWGLRFCRFFPWPSFCLLFAFLGPKFCLLLLFPSQVSAPASYYVSAFSPPLKSGRPCVSLLFPGPGWGSHAHGRSAFIQPRVRNYHGEGLNQSIEPFAIPKAQKKSWTCGR